jgi:hypothetical protein
MVCEIEQNRCYLPVVFIFTATSKEPGIQLEVKSKELENLWKSENKYLQIYLALSIKTE